MTGDGRVALEVHGDGPPLVLLHGLATTRLIWRRTIPLLRGRRVVAVDVPGFGASAPAGPGFDLDAVAARLASGLTAAGVAPGYTLVGHSMGGALAVALAARGGPSAAVLCAPAGLAPAPRWALRPAGRITAGAIRLRRAAAPLAAPVWGRRLLLGWGVADAAVVSAADARAMVRASRGARRTAEALSAVAGADLRGDLAALDVPVGAIWGAEDRVVAPAGADLVRRLRPEAPVEIVERAGHIPMMERPVAFADALERVLGALSGR